MTRTVEYNHENGGINTRIDIWIWLVPLILSGLGILIVISTTSNFTYDTSGSPFIMGLRQTRALGLGLILMIIAFSVPIPVLRQIAPVFWMFSVILMFGTFMPGLGISIGGASRWIRLGGISFQPSEVMILAVVLETAKIFEKNAPDAKKCMMSLLLIIAVSAFPLLLQPDLGTTIMLVAICMGMFVERFGWKIPLTIGMACALFFVLLLMLQPYRMRRWNAFQDPYADPLNTGFQTIQGLIAFANGGAWGAGLGHGLQKLQYLPAAYTDFIYAALGEELGLIGTLGVLLLIAFWVMRCKGVYKRAADGFETAIVWGVTLTILLPLYINVAGVTKLVPLTGMPLPFISYGGSAAIMAWMRIGILLRVQKSSLEANS